MSSGDRHSGQTRHGLGCARPSCSGCWLPADHVPTALSHCSPLPGTPGYIKCILLQRQPELLPGHLPLQVASTVTGLMSSLPLLVLGCQLIRRAPRACTMQARKQHWHAATSVKAQVAGYGAQTGTRAAGCLDQPAHSESPPLALP